MVSFNTVDFNVDKIETLAKINKLKTDYEYRIYGLRDDDENPPVFIEFNPDVFEGEITSFHTNALVSFFKSNGIELRFHIDEKEEKKKFWIGLRHDLRKEEVNIAANIVQTIVYFLEGKLDLNLQFKIPSVPKIYRYGKR
jgi:hypothetical protein